MKSDYLKAYANNKSDIFVSFLLLTIDLNFTCSSKTFRREHRRATVSK